MPSARARLARLLIRRRLGNIDRDADVETLRAMLDRLGGMTLLPKGVALRRRPQGGVPAERLTPPRAPEDAILLYLHGGAYSLGSCDSHRGFVGHIVRRSRLTALLPEYRLAPEHPFPAAVEDAVAVYRSLLGDGLAAERIVVAGDSAGGGLALSLLLSLQREGLPQPAGAALISPWTDLAATGASMRTRERADPWFSAEDLAAPAERYAHGTPLTDPRLSPLYAELAGLPPLLIQVGDDEILLDDSTRLFHRARAAGVAAELRVWPAMWHVWPMLVGRMPEANRAVDEMAGFLHAVLGTATPDATEHQVTEAA